MRDGDDLFACMVVNGSCEEDWPQVLAVARSAAVPAAAVSNAREPSEIPEPTLDGSAAAGTAALRIIPSFGYHPWYIRERDSTSFRIQLERDSDKPVERAFDDEFAGSSIEVLQGKIVRSDVAELLIKVESRYFTIHLGQSLEDSLKKPLPREQVKGLKVVAN